MPSNNAATNVTTGKPNPAGAVYVAPRGTALPTDATTALSASYTCLGFVSEDGLSNSNEVSVSDIKAWGGLIVYSSVDEFTDTFGLKLIESLNVDVLKTVYGSSNVTVDGNGNIKVKVNANSFDSKVWVFDLSMRDGTATRIVIENGSITSRDEITYNDSDAVAYGITITAYPAGSDNDTHIIYVDPGESPSY